jgi:hypothetical protein
MSAELLKYGEDEFPSRARKLVGNRQPFSAEVTGEAFRQLLPFIVKRRLADPAKLGLRPRLQALLAIVMLAEAEGQGVSFEIEPERIWVVVGSGIS